MPFVRGQRYDRLSSEGAINLACICWLTSIYEESIRRSMHHPGYLILDGIQSGIGICATKDEDFRDIGIVDGIYKLLKRISELDKYCELVVVDNHPPPSYENSTVVYYSGNPLKPPYGFIDDETS